MSIKFKLITVFALVSLVLGGAIWLEVASAYRVEKQVRLFVPATGYLLGIAEVNTGLARQAKEALDYLVTGDRENRVEFGLLTKDVERGFDLWISSAEQQQTLGVAGEEEDLEAGRQVRKVYSLWVEQVTRCFEQIDSGNRDAALQQYDKAAWTLLERQIFSILDLEMQDGFREVENAYHELLIAVGGRLWGKDDDSRMLASTQAAIDNVIAGSMVNSAISRQFSALTTYLLTGNPKSLELYEELKPEVRGAINDWFYAAYEQSVKSEPHLSTSVSHVSKVVFSLEELIELEEKAIESKKSGGMERALTMIVEGPMESPIGDHLPLMVFAALGSGSNELVAIATKGSRHGVALIGLAMLAVFLLTLRMGQSLVVSLQTLQQGMDAVSRGDLQQQIELSGKDELAQLADHFNRMSQNLYESRVEVEQLNAGLEQRVVERTRELAKANQELDAFNSAVSHDLRSPLSVIVGYSDILLENRLIDQTMLRSSLQEIRSAGEKMEGMIGTLLDLSRIDTLELNRTSIDLSKMVKSITDRFQQHCPQRRVRIILERNLLVEADYDLLLIVLENLLGNAWKYSSGRELTEIELGSDYDENRRYFFIRDNGVGFDMDEIDNLFKPFKRLHSPSEFEGTGIGLATVQRIVQCHGGEIWAEGAVGEGATFYFSLT